MDDIEQFRKLLMHKQQELDTICQTTAEAASTVELDQSRVGRLSRMDALQAQSMSQESQRRNRQELKAIQQALIRIDNGEFGECSECGEEIAHKRLELNPAATLCIECAIKMRVNDCHVQALAEIPCSAGFTCLSVSADSHIGIESV